MDLKVSEGWHEQKLAAVKLSNNSWKSGGVTTSGLLNINF